MTTGKHKEIAVLFWACCILLGLSGYALILNRFEREISASRLRAARLLADSARNEENIRKAAALRTVQMRAQHDFARFKKSPDRVAIAGLIRVVRDSARRYQTDVIAIQPESFTPERSDKMFQQVLPKTALTIRLRGRFAHLLRFLGDISRHSILVGIDDAEFTLPQATGKPGELLEATVKASLYDSALLSARAD